MAPADNGHQEINDHDRLIRVDTNLITLTTLVEKHGQASARQEKRLDAHERLLEKLTDRLDLMLTPDEARRQRDEWKVEDEDRSGKKRVRQERLIDRPVLWVSGAGVLFSTVVTIVSVFHL